MTYVTPAYTNLLTGDGPNVGSLFGSPQWGIFGSSGPLLVADSVKRVEYARDYSISDYPQEQGAWASYNKVQLPYTAKVTFIVSTTRAAFLQSIESAIASLAFVSVVTPEITYPSANLVHYSYSRDDKNGVSAILVQVWVQEVRLPSQAAAGGGISPGNYASPNGAYPSTSGNLQPIPTTLTGGNYTPSNTPGGGYLSPGGAYTHCGRSW